MKNHIKIYLSSMGVKPCERFEDMYIPCEFCGGTATDIHHIQPRGMGGSKTKDYLENLMALCRECHSKAEAKKISKASLIDCHYQELEKRVAYRVRRGL